MEPSKYCADAQSEKSVESSFKFADPVTSVSKGSHAILDWKCLPEQTSSKTIASTSDSRPGNLLSSLIGWRKSTNRIPSTLYLYFG